MTYITPHMAPSLANHTLTCLLDTDEVKVYRMARPNDSAYRVQITFTPEGIAIQGDVGLGAAQNGICSRLGKGRGWFGSHKSEDYLCSKFLSKTWQREAAVRDLRASQRDAKAELQDAIKGNADPEDIAGLQEEADAWASVLMEWDHDEGSSKELYEAGSERINDFWDDRIGMDYPLADAGWLCAIQQRFAVLLSETKAPVEETA